MPVRIPSHLYRNRHGTFYFRLLVPVDLRHTLKRRELRFSMGTEARQQAVAAAMPIIADLPQLITDLRRMKEQEDGPTNPNEFLQKWLAEKRKNIVLRERIEKLEEALLDAQRQLRDSVPRERAERGVKVAYDKGQLIGKRQTEEAFVFPPPAIKTPLFSELMASYLKSLTQNRASGGRKKPPTAKTLEEYERTISFFIQVMGDLRIGAISSDEAGAYFSTLKALPANLNRKPIYRGKTIEEILALNHPPQAEFTASNKMERISSMFRWALAEKRKWGIDANPFAGFGQSDDRESTRRPFTLDELRALLNHPNYQKKRFPHSYGFWLIPLATFTGARLGELAQLDLKDFVEVDGIPCIDINDTDAVEEVIDGNGRKKRVKNKNAKRLVPIHPALIEMGLLRHVQRLRDDGKVHLFPELSRTRRDGPGHAASNWFQKFRRRVGLNAKQETVFHSFRNGFITAILDAGESPHMLAPIVGHEADLITGKVYWNKKDASKRKPTVELFQLPEDILRLFPMVEGVAIQN